MHFRYAAAVGMNPFRPQKKSWFDYVFVASALVVACLLVAWAAFG